jgi:hypothetical protein
VVNAFKIALQPHTLRSCSACTHNSFITNLPTNAHSLHLQPAYLSFAQSSTFALELRLAAFPLLGRGNMGCCVYSWPPCAADCCSLARQIPSVILQHDKTTILPRRYSFLLLLLLLLLLPLPLMLPLLLLLLLQCCCCNAAVTLQPRHLPAP